MNRRCFLAATILLAGWLSFVMDTRSWGEGDGSDLRLVAVGVLQKAAERNGQDGYVIADGDGQVSFRVAAAEGTDLKGFLGQRVQIVGRLESGSDLQRRTIVAERLTAAKKSLPAHFVVLNAESAKPPPKSTKMPKSAAAAPAAESSTPTQTPAAGTTRSSESLPPLTGPAPTGEGPILIDEGSLLNEDGSALTEDEVRELLQTPESESGWRGPWGSRPGPPGECSRNSPEWVWGDLEYLWWSMKGMDLPPLVTTSPGGTPVAQAGVLGEPGTAVLFGGSDVLDSGRDGARLRLGAWLGAQKRLGLAAEYFRLEDDQLLFNAASGGVAIIARPYYDVDPSLDPAAGPTSRLISYPDLAAGSVEVAAGNSLESFGAHLRGNLLCRGGVRYQPCRNTAGTHPGFRLDLLGGYRYLDLDDSLVIRDLATVWSRDQRWGSSAVTESFETSNEFQGGEIGVSGEYYRNRWCFDGLAKLAIGRTQQRVDIRGSTVSSVGGVVTAYEEGLLALDTNIGGYSRKQTDVLCEFGVTVGYLLAQNLQVTCGYTFIYWPHVVRAGDQVDLNVNGSHLPTSAVPPAGPARPAFAFQETSFWTQGLALGVDYRW